MLKKCLYCGKDFNEPKTGPVLFFCSDSHAFKYSNLPTKTKRLNNIFYRNAITSDLNNDYLMRLVGVSKW